MMKRTIGMLLVGALAACGGEKGDKGDPGDPGLMGDKGDKGDPGQTGSVTAAVSLLTPTALFAGRGALVQVSGVATHFGDGSTVDFGDAAIKVTQVAAGSVANLRAQVAVGLDAKIGPHDVKVSTPPQPAGGSSEDVMLKGGFTVNASLSHELPAGAMMPVKAVQGGFADLVLRNLDDRDNPFTSGVGQPAPQLVAGATGIGNPTISSNRLTQTGLIDVLAPAGGLRVAATQKDRQGSDVGYVSDPADKLAPQVSSRMPTELTSGMAKTGEALGEARATNLYKITTAMDNQVVHVAYSSLGTTLAGSAGMPPRVTLVGYMAPASGRFRDGRGLETSETAGMTMGTVSARNTLMLLPKAGDYYFVTYTSDLSGSMTTSYSVTARWAAGTNLGSLKEPMGGDTPAMPVATIMSLDKPYYATDGAADSNYDEDFIKFTAAKSGRVYVAVTTTPGVSMGIGLRQGDCSTILAASRYSASGTVLNETDVAAGTAYCVRVAGNGQATSYQVIVTPALN